MRFWTIRASADERRVRVYVEPRDIWVGVYVAENAVYICPLPLLVIKIRRQRRG